MVELHPLLHLHQQYKSLLRLLIEPRQMCLGQSYSEGAGAPQILLKG
jgi:hypothetical protein